MTPRAADRDVAEVKVTEAKKTGDGVLLCVVAAYAAAFVVFGFLVDAPADIARGLVAICVSRDTLLTDYFARGRHRRGLRECRPAHPLRVRRLSTSRARR